MALVCQRKIQIRLKKDFNIKFHLYSFKLSPHVKTAMQYFENFGG